MSLEIPNFYVCSLAERFIRGENCLEWLQDLQRALRRDDDAIREVACKVGRPPGSLSPPTALMLTLLPRLL